MQEKSCKTDNPGDIKFKIFTADETYIKIRGIKAYIWFIMDAASRSLSWIPHIYGARRWCMHSFDAYGFQTRLQAS